MLIYKNLLEEEFADKLYNYANDVMYGKNTEITRVSSNWAWPLDARDDSTSVFVIEMNKDDLKKFEDTLRLSGIFDPQKHQPVNVANLYVWTKDSYIPRHTDSHFGKAVTVYLNRVWEYDDGGMFMWQDGEEWKAVLPAFNLCTVNEGGLNHGTAPVKTTARFRITIQCFIYNRNDGIIE
jgi:hypothetical protein